MVEIDDEIMQVWKKLIIADNLKYWRSEQKNFSAEAEAVFEKIQKNCL